MEDKLAECTTSDNIVLKSDLNEEKEIENNLNRLIFSKHLSVESEHTSNERGKMLHAMIMARNNTTATNQQMQNG